MGFGDIVVSVAFWDVGRNLEKPMFDNKSVILLLKEVFANEKFSYVEDGRDLEDY